MPAIVGVVLLVLVEAALLIGPLATVLSILIGLAVAGMVVLVLWALGLFRAY